MPVQALAFSAPLLVGDLGEDLGEHFAADHQDLVDTPVACSKAQEDSVSYPCRSGIETWVGPVGLEIEIAARPVTEVVVLLVTAVVALLVTAVEVRVPSAVPLGAEDLDGREGPSEDPSGALVPVRELQVRGDAVDHQEGPWAGFQGGN
ncbi:hypothetical protein Daus18300_001697 [Diaporthe australafricana]|uniref:Uncharacterized protein n=1 Tax=Diaporthe australafricana TaxID=127596 RepID=A0ABR3XV39_9PEZI